MAEPADTIEGDIQQLDSDHPVTERWPVMRGGAPDRACARQITLFDSVGFMIEDFDALRYTYGKVKDNAYGEMLDIIADPR